jgi:hypothetical protein
MAESWQEKHFKTLTNCARNFTEGVSKSCHVTSGTQFEFKLMTYVFQLRRLTNSCAMTHCGEIRHKSLSHFFE